MKQCLAVLAGFGVISASAFAGGLPQGKAVGVSYVQMSAYATLTPISGKPNLATLTLQGTDPYVTYFSDRPNRIVGKLTNQAYLNTWKDGGKNSYDDIAPNAVLSGIQSSATQQTHDVSIVMEITHPHYNPTAGTITYDAKILAKKHQAVPTLPLKLYSNTLFIDPCLACIN